MNWEIHYLKWLNRWHKLQYAVLRWRLRRYFTFGPGCDIYPGCIFYQGSGNVIFEEGSIIERAGMGAHFWVERGAEIRFGPRAWLRGRYQPNVFSLTPGAKVEIGSDALLTGVTISVKKGLKAGVHLLCAYGVRILDSDFHDLDNSHKEQSAPITIGDYVWLTSDVTVLKGVTIGDHCVIGAGSLVTSDIPSNTLAVGRPAKPIRTIEDRSAAR